MYKRGSINHPECEKGEVFLCGVFHFAEAFDLGFNTVRVGVTMYDVHGEVIPEQYPVFISQVEYETCKQ